MRIKVLPLYLSVFIVGAATPELKIVSPPDGTIVAPGGVLMVTLEATPFAFQSVLIAGKPIGWKVVTPPYRFAVTIDPNTSAGTETLEALGAIEPGKFITSPSLTIDVERPDSPNSLKTVFNPLRFDHVGDDFDLSVSGTFADGAIVYLTRSRYTSYKSASPAVATVEPEGHVTAKGPGTTVVTIRHRDQSLSVPVTVKGK